MSEKIVQLNEKVIKGQIKKLARSSVDKMLDELLKSWEMCFLKQSTNAVHSTSTESTNNQKVCEHFLSRAKCIESNSLRNWKSDMWMWMIFWKVSDATGM